jgi:hypothetical protein
MQEDATDRESRQYQRNVPHLLSLLWFFGFLWLPTDSGGHVEEGVGLSDWETGRLRRQRHNQQGERGKVSNTHHPLPALLLQVYAHFGVCTWCVCGGRWLNVWERREGEGGGKSSGARKIRN